MVKNVDVPPGACPSSPINAENLPFQSASLKQKVAAQSQQRHLEWRFYWQRNVMPHLWITGGNPREIPKPPAA